MMSHEMLSKDKIGGVYFLRILCLTGKTEALIPIHNIIKILGFYSEEGQKFNGTNIITNESSFVFKNMQIGEFVEILRDEE